MREPSAPAYAAAASNVSAPGLRLFTDFAKRASHVPPQTRKGEYWISRAGNRSLRPKPPLPIRQQPERSPCAVPLRNMPAACRMRRKPAFSLRNSPPPAPRSRLSLQAGAFHCRSARRDPSAGRTAPKPCGKKPAFLPFRRRRRFQPKGVQKRKEGVKCRQRKHIRPVGGSGRNEAPALQRHLPSAQRQLPQKTQTAGSRRLRQPETHKQVLFFLHILYCGNYHKSETARAGSGKGCGLDFLPQRRKKPCPGSRIPVSRSRRSV